jgi:flavorubredoxin
VKRALIVYSTRKGATEALAACIADGLRGAGIETEVRPSDQVTRAAHLQGFDAYLFGSPTYHGEMMNSLKQLLFLCDSVNLRSKVGGAFGAFGWSGEAPGRIFETMKRILGMRMVQGPLQVASAEEEEHCERARAYGRLVAAEIERS